MSEFTPDVLLRVVHRRELTANDLQGKTLPLSLESVSATPAIAGAIAQHFAAHNVTIPAGLSKEETNAHIVEVTGAAAEAVGEIGGYRLDVNNRKAWKIKSDGGWDAVGLAGVSFSLASADNTEFSMGEVNVEFAVNVQPPAGH